MSIQMLLLKKFMKLSKTFTTRERESEREREKVASEFFLCY